MDFILNSFGTLGNCEDLKVRCQLNKEHQSCFTYKEKELESSVPNNEVLVIGEFGIVNKPALCAFIACHLLSTYRSCRLQYFRFPSLFKRRWYGIGYYILYRLLFII